MKILSKIIILLLPGILTPLLSQTDTENMHQFIGEWQGEGHFYNVNLSSEVGIVRFTLYVSSDMEITGSVGNAEIVDAEIEVDDWNDGYSIQGTIVGQIFPGNDFQKKRITLLLNEVDDDISVGDFHLANNFIFDFSMRPGGVTLSRTP